MPLDSETRAKLREKVEETDLALALNNRHRNKKGWAQANLDHAEALSALGDEEIEPTAFEHYRDAINAFEKALSVYSAEDTLAQWGGANVSLARTLRNYGQREGGENGLLRLRRAQKVIETVYSALPEREGAFDQAMLSLENGFILRALSETDRELGKVDYLKRATDAFRDAAHILRHKERFDHWVSALTTLGLTLNECGRSQQGEQAQQTINAAIEAFKSPLAYYNPVKNPKEWAICAFEQGRSYVMLAQSNNGKIRDEALRNAANNFQAVFERVQAHLNPDLLIILKGEWAGTLSQIAQLPTTNNALDLLDKAIELHKSNIELLKNKGDTANAAMAMGFLGKDYLVYANITQAEKRRYYFNQAINVLRQAHSDELRKSHPSENLSNFIELGTALHALANLDENQKLELYEEATAIYEEALKAVDKNKDPALWAKLHQWSGLAYAYMGEADKTSAGINFLKHSELNFRQALSVTKPNQNFADYIRLQNNIGHLLYTLARRVNSNSAAPIYLEAQKTMEHVLSLIDAETMAEEWIGGKLHLGLILWRFASLSELPEQSYQRSEQAMLDALKLVQRYGNEMTKLKVQINLALLYNEWSCGNYSRASFQRLKKAEEIFSQLIDASDKIDLEREVEQARIDREKTRTLIKQFNWKNRLLKFCGSSLVKKSNRTK